MSPTPIGFDYAAARALFAPQSLRRTAAPIEEPTAEEPATLAYALIDLGPCPCDGSENFARCKAGEACERYAVWVAHGRDNDQMPRQPTIAIYQKVYRQPVIGPRRPELQRIRDRLAVRNARETSYLDLVEGL